MADIVSSLFGLSPMQEQAELTSRQRNFDLGTLIGQAGTTGFMTPTQSQNYINRQGAQAALAGTALRGIGGLFGLQDQQLQRATQLEGILGQTQQELGEEANNPTVFYPELQRKLAEGGFTREAMQVGQVAQKAIQDFGTGQAQQRKFVAEATAKEQETLREEQLRQALTTLPANATDDDYLAVVRQFAPAKDVMNVIEKKQLANEARQAKTEDLQFRLAEETKRAAERNETLLEQARLQGASSRDLVLMRINSDESIAAMDANNKRTIAEMKASTTATTKGAPKDVAEAESVLAGVDFTINEIKNAKKLLDTGKAVFSVKQNAIARGSLATGNPTENALNQNKVKRQVREGVNQILVAAKGTQTEGDAKRAQEMYLAAENTNSTEAWKDAMDALLRAQEKVKAEKKSYISTRGFGTTNISGKDKEALDWANANPNDPRATQIKQRLGQ